MRANWTALVAGIALAAAPLAGHALGKNEKGCLVGGAAGGVGGKLLGDHPILGAAAGCAVGTYVVRDRDLKKREEGKREEARREEERRNSHRSAHALSAPADRTTSDGFRE
jgi:hypothetical protein